MEKCEFEYEGIKCTAETSKDKPFRYMDKVFPRFSIARCKVLCPSHYREVVKDNIRKFNRGITITEELDFTKQLGFNSIWSFLGISQITEKEVKDNNGN